MQAVPKPQKGTPPTLNTPPLPDHAEHVLDVLIAGRVRLSLPDSRHAILVHELLRIRDVGIGGVQAVDVPRQVVPVQQAPPGQGARAVSGGGMGPGFRLRVGGPEALVIIEVDLEEPVERGGQDLGAPELLGEDYR